jgi:peroxiredoxin family protein
LEKKYKSLLCSPFGKGRTSSKVDLKMTTENVDPKKQCVTIILHSGSYDRVTNALSLAIVALSMEMEAHILLTYEGLRRFIKGHLEDAAGTDNELYGMMKKGIDSGRFHTIEEKLETAHEMGLKLYACTTALATLGEDKKDLVDEVDEVMGLTTFMNLAKEAIINWYI